MSSVVIVGGGFAGLWAAAHLPRDIDVTLVDPRAQQHFLPLLPDLVGRKLPADALLLPLGGACERAGVSLVPEACTGFDLGRRAVVTGSGEIGYDVLLIAGGSVSNFYGSDELAASALTLDSVDDALRLRDAVSGGEYRAYVVSGGGYTGVEAATNIRRLLVRRGRTGRIVIVDPADALCVSIPDPYQAYIERNVRSMGVEVRLGVTVERAGEDGVRLSNGETVADALLVWTAGVRTPDFVAGLDLPKTKQGRLLVDEHLRIREGVFAAGDCAAVAQAGGHLRMGVQFAIAEGICAAENIARTVAGRPLRPFRPRDLGYVVPMANLRGCGRALGVPMRGVPPVLLHYLMCIYRTPGARRRVRLWAGLLRRG